jgi:hypothetical protein
MGREPSKLQQWMLDLATYNNATEADATRDENSRREHGCDLYFCEVLDGFFRLRSRSSIERRRTMYESGVYYRVRQGHYSKFWPHIYLANVVVRRAARRLAGSGLVSLHHKDGVNLAKGPSVEAIERHDQRKKQ